MERTIGALGVEVRLANDHLLTALPYERALAGAPFRLGEAVLVEMSPHEMKGWRLARRP